MHLRVLQEDAGAERAEPGEDVATRLVRAERDGKLDDDEAASTLANLLIGAMESYSAIANGVALLLTHRDQLSKLLANMELPPIVSRKFCATRVHFGCSVHASLPRSLSLKGWRSRPVR